MRTTKITMRVKYMVEAALAMVSWIVAFVTLVTNGKELTETQGEMVGCMLLLCLLLTILAAIDRDAYNAIED